MNNNFDNRICNKDGEEPPPLTPKEKIDPKKLLDFDPNMGEAPKIESIWYKYRLSNKKEQEAIAERRFQLLDSMYHSIIHLRNAVIEGEQFNMEHRLWELALNINRILDRSFLLDTHCHFFVKNSPEFSYEKWDDKMEHCINRMWEIGDNVIEHMKEHKKAKP